MDLFLLIYYVNSKWLYFRPLQSDNTCRFDNICRAQYRNILITKVGLLVPELFTIKVYEYVVK